MLNSFVLQTTVFSALDRCVRVAQYFLLILGAIAALSVAYVASNQQSVTEWLRTFQESSVTISDDEVAETPEAAVEESLNPRMQLALGYAARKYRVSAEALRPIFQVAQLSAREFSLDPLLVVAVIAIESKFNPLSESAMGAQGLMQVIPRFHKDKLPPDAGKLPFFDPAINVRVGTRALYEYIRRNGDLVSGLQQFAGALDDPEQGYANKVLAERERMESAVRRRASAES